MRRIIACLFMAAATMGSASAQDDPAEASARLIAGAMKRCNNDGDCLNRQIEAFNTLMDGSDAQTEDALSQCVPEGHDIGDTDWEKAQRCVNDLLKAPPAPAPPSPPPAASEDLSALAAAYSKQLGDTPGKADEDFAIYAKAFPTPLALALSQLTFGRCGTRDASPELMKAAGGDKAFKTQVGTTVFALAAFLSHEKLNGPDKDAFCVRVRSLVEAEEKKATKL